MVTKEICEYCPARTGVTGGFPFDENTLVFKVMNKVVQELFYIARPPLSNSHIEDL